MMLHNFCGALVENDQMSKFHYVLIREGGWIVSLIRTIMSSKYAFFLGFQKRLFQSWAKLNVKVDGKEILINRGSGIEEEVESFLKKTTSQKDLI